MGKRKGKRIISLLISFLLAAAALLGCNSSASAKNADRKGGKDRADKDAVFQDVDCPLEDLLKSAGGKGVDDMGAENINFTGILAAGERYYVMYSDLTEGEKTWLASFDQDGGNYKTIELPSQGDDGWTSAFAVSPDGSIYIAQSTFDDEGGSTWELIGLDAKGKEAFRSPIKAGDDFYVQQMTADEDEIYILEDSGVRFFSTKDGKESGKAGLPKEYSFGGLCLDSEGVPILIGTGEGGMLVWKLDRKSSAFSEVKLNAGDFYLNGGVSGGVGGYDFFSADDSAIYGFRLGDAAPSKVLDFIASDMNIDYLNSFSVLSAESILLLSFDADSTLEPRLLKKVDPASVGDRTLLTLGCAFADADLRKAVINFNKKNEKYRIRIQEYPYEEKDDEWTSSFNNEIASGNIPDLICISQDMPLESYASKGLFEDIEARFKEDKEISKNKYLTNVIDAFRMDGKMYFVVPDFSVIGLVGSAKDFGDSKGVTVQKLEKLIKQRGTGYDTVMGLSTRESVLSWIMYCATGEYVDWDKGTCSFNSDSFIDLLKFVKKFPAKVKESDTIWEESEGWVRDGKQLLRDFYLYDFTRYMEERYGYFGADVSIMGFFGDGTNSPSIQQGIQLAMSSGSANKDGCWEFMRSFYLDEYQDGVQYRFPVSEKALKAMAEKAMQPVVYTYTDEKGKKVEEVQHDIVTINGSDIEIPTPKQKDVDEVIRVIRGCSNTASYDTMISNIINEECGAFFSGQKSAEEVADIIQSRVKIYISEAK